MGTHPQSTIAPTQQLESENTSHVQSVGLGVSEAALDVFSNFVQHVVANVAPPSEITPDAQAHNPQPRRSKRFATRPEGEASWTLTLPAPPQPLVRARACVSVFHALQLGFGH